MKLKALLLLAIALLIIIPSAVAQEGEATEEPMECPAEIELPDLEGRVITVAVENAYIPFNFLDPVTGEPAGWDYDTIDEICARLNCVPEYVETSWDGMIVAVSNGEFDVAADGITITEERDEIVDFSIGYIKLEQVLLVRIDEDRFTTVQEFFDGDFTLGVQPGTTNYETAVELLGSEDSPRLLAFETFPVAVQALIAGDVDAVIMDNVAGQGYVGENAESLTYIDEGITAGEELGFAFPNDSDLVEAFNAALLSMMCDGTLDEINSLWFGDDAPIPGEEEEPVATPES
ncbi:MAG: ABC transporter substrate-binding protein [Phototrophicales bacterium]|nr:MAG: ABC transporter substrate-binding protein [Phototrophicales bacterium]